MAAFQMGKNKSRASESVLVEKGQVHPGKVTTGLTDEEKALRKLLGLPVTKDLVYYSSARDETSKMIVDKFEVDEAYQITDPWFELLLHIGEKRVKIHHRYFAEMQNPTFISDMSKFKE